MDKRTLLGNASVAFVAQGISFLLSVVMSLLVPKVLGVEQYGYWQLFLFYASYTGFFALGLNDGVYLIDGGKTRGNVDKKLRHTMFAVGVSYELIFALAIVVAALLGNFGPDREFVVLWTAVFLILNNTVGYLGYMLQAINETKKFSYSCIIERLIFLIPLILFLILKIDSFEPYIYAFAFSTFCKLFYLGWYLRDFLFSGFVSASEAAVETMLAIRIGIKLMFANIASMLILGFARFMIDMVWGISTFGELSFSLSLVYFFLTFVTQAAMVLFPVLRQSKESEITRFFTLARNMLGFIFPVVYLLYFPMVWFLGIWLPQFSGSLVFLALLLPICVFDSRMNIICTTLFKVRREEKKLLFINVIATIISGLLSIVGAYLVKSIFVVIIGAVITIIARSMVAEMIIGKELGVARSYVSAGELATSAVFVLLASLSPMPFAFAGTMITYSIFLWFFRKEFRDTLIAIFKKPSISEELYL